MTDLEDRLRRHLAEQARTAQPRADLDDLTQRLARGNGRRRAVAAIGVCAALVAGGIGGFAIGRSDADDGGGDVVAAEDPTGDVPAPDATTIPPDPAPVDTIVDTMTVTTVPATWGGDGSATPDTTVLLDRFAEPGAFAGADSSLSLVTTRTTATGDALRLYRQPAWAPGDDGNPFWDTPATCVAVSSAVAEWSTELAVGTAVATIFQEPRDGLVATAVPVGVAEGVPTIVVVVQVAPDVHEVTASFPGGATDAAGPVDGLAVLAGPAPDLDQQAANASGDLGVAVSTDTGLVDDSLSPYGTDLYPPECQPPAPSLPEPGEQPADPDAARAELEAVFELVHDGSIPVEERAGHLEGGPDLMVPIVEQLLASSYADQVRAARGVIDDLVFTAPDEAWVEYHIEIDGSPSFSGRFGQMLLVDGSWVLASETYCRDVALAGISCPPA
jgi:hypothetical protein